MEYISTTELRTESMRLRDSLAKGANVYLVHRSKIIGVIMPANGNKPNVATEEGLMEISRLFATGKNYSYKKRDALKRAHLEKKYGKSIS